MYFLAKKFLKILFVIFIFCNNSYAKNSSYSKKSNREAFLVIDEKNHQILYNKNGNQKRYPASLTKMLTLYITFDSIHQKKLRMNQKLSTSNYASSKPNSKLGLKPGEYISVKDAVLGLVIRSANDAAVVLAEAISGSESNFANKMNYYAKKLGMNNSNFVNASGLHNKHQYSSAIDMAKLAIAIKRDFPEYYSLFSQTDFEFKGQLIRTTNNVTRLYPGAKGMKTGYIGASGYNLVTTAERANKKLVGVIFGGKSSKSRDNSMIRMLDQYFANSKSSIVSADNKIRRAYIKSGTIKTESKKNIIAPNKRQNFPKRFSFNNKIACVI